MQMSQFLTQHIDTQHFDSWNACSWFTSALKLAVWPKQVHKSPQRLLRNSIKKCAAHALMTAHLYRSSHQSSNTIYLSRVHKTAWSGHMSSDCTLLQNIVLHQNSKSSCHHLPSPVAKRTHDKIAVTSRKADTRQANAHS